MDGLSFTKLHEIGRELAGEGMEFSELTVSEYLDKVRAVLQVENLGGNNWSKYHRTRFFLGYKQVCRGRKSETNDCDLMTRQDFETIEDFILERNFHLDGERVPTKEDVEQLEGVKQRSFLQGTDYVYDDGGNGLGVFQINYEGELCMRKISDASYVRVRTIKSVSPYSKEQIQRLKVLKEFDWIPEAKKQKIKVTPEYIEIMGIRLKISDEIGEQDNDGKMFRGDVQPYTLTNEQWRDILNFIGEDPAQQYMFFYDFLKMQKPHYVTASEVSDDRNANECILTIDRFEGVSIEEEFSEGPENWTGGRFKFSGQSI